MSKVYYSQADSRWANYPYPSSSYPKATIKSGGCGPTSGAMIISSLKETIFPNQMGDIFRANGYRAASGTSGNAFPFIAKKWDLTCNVRVKLDDAIACLKRGGMVVANVKAGSVFSTGGHYIVLAYMKDENTIAIFDPYLYAGKFNTASRKGKVVVSGNTVFISYQNMKNYGNYSNLYCFEPSTTPKPVPSGSKYFAGQSVVVTIPIYKTGSTNGDLVQVENRNMDDPNKKQFWINKSVIENDKVHALGTVCYAEGKLYIVQVFTELFWVKEDNISLPESKSNNQSSSISNTVGQIKRFKANTTIYSNSNLTGTKYNYKANTKIKVLQNVSKTIDKIQVVQTGRIGYVNISSYK